MIRFEIADRPKLWSCIVTGFAVRIGDTAIPDEFPTAVDLE